MYLHCFLLCIAYPLTLTFLGIPIASWSVGRDKGALPRGERRCDGAHARAGWRQWRTGEDQAGDGRARHEHDWWQLVQLLCTCTQLFKWNFPLNLTIFYVRFSALGEDQASSTETTTRNQSNGHSHWRRQPHTSSSKTERKARPKQKCGARRPSARRRCHLKVSLLLLLLELKVLACAMRSASLRVTHQYFQVRCGSFPCRFHNCFKSVRTQPCSSVVSVRKKIFIVYLSRVCMYDVWLCLYNLQIIIKLNTLKFSQLPNPSCDTLLRRGFKGE